MSEKAATPPTLHRLRVQGRKLVADLAAKARDALQARGDGSVTYEAIGKRLPNPETGKALSHEYVSRWFESASGVAIALGDVVALPRELAREILVRVLASLDDGRPIDERDTVDHLVVCVGDACSRLQGDRADNGKIDQHAVHAANFARIAEIALRGHRAAMALDAAGGVK